MLTRITRIPLHNLSLCFLVAFSAALHAAQPQHKELATIGNCRVTLVQGDIIEQRFDKRAAIVNAANAQLAHGAGIALAIKNKYELADERGLLEQFQINNGRAFTTGDALLARPPFNYTGGPLFIVHAVGPDCRVADEKRNRVRYLTSAYQASLDCIEYTNCNHNDLPIKAIAFPTISTGIFGYSIEKATPIALRAVKTWLENNPDTKLTEIRFVVWDQPGWACYTNPKNKTVLTTMRDQDFDAYVAELEEDNQSNNKQSLLTPTQVCLGAAAVCLAACALVAGRGKSDADKKQEFPDLALEPDRQREALVVTG